MTFEVEDACEMWLHVEDDFDEDGELLFEARGGVRVYLNRKKVEALHEHLGKLLEIQA